MQSFFPPRLVLVTHQTETSCTARCVVSACCFAPTFPCSSCFFFLVASCTEKFNDLTPQLLRSDEGEAGLADRGIKVAMCQGCVCVCGFCVWFCVLFSFLLPLLLSLVRQHKRGRPFTRTGRRSTLNFHVKSIHFVIHVISGAAIMAGYKRWA